MSRTRRVTQGRNDRPIEVAADQLSLPVGMVDPF